MAWLKLHDEILGDPKLMRAARAGAKELHWMPWLLAFARKANDEGRLTVGGEKADPQDISALIPGAKPKAITRALAELLALDILIEDTDGALRFAQWDYRQFRAKPSDSRPAVAARVRRYRAKRNTPEGVTEGVTVTDYTDTDTDTVTKGVTPRLPMSAPRMGRSVVDARTADQTNAELAGVSAEEYEARRIAMRDALRAAAREQAEPPRLTVVRAESA